MAPAPAPSIWPTFLITIGLLALAGFSIAQQVNQAMGGAIVGYIAAYWLPAVRVDPRKGGPLDGRPVDPLQS